MTLTQKLLGVASLGVAFVGASFAHDVSATDENGGLLGVRYAEAGFGYLDVNDVDEGAFAAGLNINVPVTATLDLNVGYAYAWDEEFSSLYTNSVDVTAVGYITLDAFRPFVAAGVGYAWDSDDFGGDEYASWDAEAGVEYSINDVAAVRVSGGYGSGFEDDHNDGLFSGTVGVNYWFTSSLAGTVSAELIEGGHVGYGASVVLHF